MSGHSFHLPLDEAHLTPHHSLPHTHADGHDTSARDGQYHLSDDAISASFFPVLPYGYSRSVELDGWTMPAVGAATVSTVYDHEAGCEVIELLAAPSSSAAMGGKAAAAHAHSAGLVRMQDSVGRNSGLLTTARGTHSLVDAVRVQGATGGASATDTTLSQRLRGSDFAQHAAAKSPAADFGASMTRVISPPPRRVGGKRVGGDDDAAAALSDPSCLSFPHSSQFIGCTLPILNLHVKSLYAFFGFQVEVEDTTGRLYRIDVSNARTVVRLRLDSADLPLTLRDGWNRLTLDLAHLTSTCFAATFAQVHRVQLRPSARVRRVFFSAEAYPDFALPPSLRVFSDDVYDAKRAEDEERKRWEKQQQQQQRITQQQPSNGGRQAH